jgi:hypothetical protein
MRRDWARSEDLAHQISEPERDRQAVAVFSSVEVDSLSGNLALRTMVHEGWHRHQFDMLSANTIERWNNVANNVNQRFGPLEWTQPGYTARGAWNFEMNTPYGSLTNAWFAIMGAAEKSTQPGSQ